MNAMARCEALLQPMLAACGSEEQRRKLSREMVEWLSAAPDSTLKALLLDAPCPSDFLLRWTTAEQMKIWANEKCIRPSKFFAALGAQAKK
jgi:hypothetical protein